MKKTLIVFITLVSHMATANTIKMNQYLVKMISEIDSMIVLINKAAKEQPDNVRVKFNFKKYRNSKGGYSNGLKEDLLEMKKAIVAHINKPIIAPKKVSHMRFDYVDEE